MMEWRKVGDRFWRADSEHVTITIIEPFFGADGEYTVRIAYTAGTRAGLEDAKALGEKVAGDILMGKYGQAL